jgi:ATP-dependent helicase HrpA
VKWSFGELPELLEIVRGSQTLIGFPALIDEGQSVRIEVFDEPSVAKAKHRQGLRKLFALQIKDSIKYLEKNSTDLPSSVVMNFVQAMKNLQSALKVEASKGASQAHSSLSLEALKPQLMELALDRAFLMEPLPLSETQFNKRLEEGRPRLTLIASEVSRLVQTILNEFCNCVRKLKDTSVVPSAQSDMAQQLQRLLHKNFLLDTPYSQLQHFPRYLKAVYLRLEKYRVDPKRDGDKQSEITALEQAFWREWMSRKGVSDARLSEYRWMLEELRVSLFAQELKTPQPVSAKRLERVWAQLKA